MPFNTATPNRLMNPIEAGTLRYSPVALQRFLALVPIWATWDDHDVRNNFSGPYDPQMPLGRQALLEYWPIATPPGDPTRLYRHLRYGADLEIFVLDTRQYRSRNSDMDGPNIGYSLLFRQFGGDLPPVVVPSAM